MKSIKVERALKKLGEDLKTARLRRMISTEDMSERLGVSRPTLNKMEKGDPSVSIGKYAAAFMLFDKLDVLELILDNDKTGSVILESKLPKRIRSKRIWKKN